MALAHYIEELLVYLIQSPLVPFARARGQFADIHTHRDVTRVVEEVREKGAKDVETIERVGRDDVFVRHLIHPHVRFGVGVTH